MNIVKCDRGHFYNGDRYQTCPHCEEMLPVGWLVGISGPVYGKQYPLYACDNIIDNCILSFDLENQKIVIKVEHTTNDVFVNDISVPFQASRYVTHGDRIRIGDSVGMLVELCREGFSWWTKEKRQEKQPVGQQSAADVRIDDIDRAFAEESEPVKRPDISGIRAQMQKKRNVSFSVQKTPVYSEISAKDAALVTTDETNVLTTQCIDEMRPEEEEGTNVLATATWRCPMCNGLNSEYAKVCKICGSTR